jgi:hypothetical protein
MTFHDYQSKAYRDTFDISPDIGYQFGAVMTYTASDMFAVHTELIYENRQRKLENIAGMTPRAKSEFTSHYLTMPFLMQINVGRGDFSFYANGGIKMNFWLGGNGIINLEEFDEFVPGDRVYKLVYKQDKSNGDDKLAFLHPNRVQYGFTGGAGAYFNIIGDARVFVDFRYSFSHSNLGFNSSPDFSFAEYFENFEYRHHSINISAGYVIQFNAQLKRKGRSTIKKSNR